MVRDAAWTVDGRLTRVLQLTPESASSWWSESRLWDVN